MELLTDQSLYRAVTKCQSEYNYSVVVIANSMKQRDFVFKELCSIDHSEHAYYLRRVNYITGSNITVLAADTKNMCGRRADLVLLDPDLFSADTLPVFRAMETRNKYFKTQKE